MNIPFNPVPDIHVYQENMNPTLSSPNSPFTLSFNQTRDTLMDIDTYRSFIKNVESRFRNSITYKNYKGFMCGIGFDRCQFHGFIRNDGDNKMATIEMHHAVINLFDISLMITEYLLNTVGYVTTFDVVQILKEEHKSHNIALVMLSKTPHQLCHNDASFYIHPSMCIGNWPLLIKKYKAGLTQDLSFKLLHYLQKSIEEDGSTDGNLLSLRDEILDWSVLS